MTGSRFVPGRAETEIDWDAAGIETELGWSLQAVYQAFSRTAAPAVAAVPGGPRGYQVLVAITTEEPTSQLLLATRLGIDKTAMTYVIDALESERLAERRANPRDRRIREVLPTDSGRALLAQARLALRDVETALMRDLDDEEQTQLRRLLARVALGAADAGAGVTPANDPQTYEQPVAAPHRSARRRQPSSSES